MPCRKMILLLIRIYLLHWRFLALSILTDHSLEVDVAWVSHVAIALLLICTLQLRRGSDKINAEKNRVRKPLFVPCFAFVLLVPENIWP